VSNSVQTPLSHKTYADRRHRCFSERENDHAKGESDMKKTMVVSAALASMVLLSGAAAAQGTSQTVEFAKVDIQKLAAGYRASKVIGSDVLNDANQSIGKIDDLLVSPDGTAPFAVLSIGGFLGMDTHLVVVPYDRLKLVGNKIVL
jgi:sporulation protein YlmC with PRC-barrel domain